MKNLIIAFSLLLTANAFCEWPSEVVSAAKIASEPFETLSGHFDGALELQMGADDHREIVIKLDPAKNEYHFTVSIAFYQAAPWSYESGKETEQSGWSRSPGDGLQSIHSDVGGLLAILDQASIQFSRTNTIRTGDDPKDIKAVWNKVEFSLPRERLTMIYGFLREFYGAYRPETKISIYVKRKALSEPSGETSPGK